ncbi:MAG TPA: alpha/beta fold hydrolase [Burkholderiaceae bacterium]|nr:alpha/beta fold hydrolase [Burkholderiaceae bacterium]
MKTASVMLGVLLALAAAPAARAAPNAPPTPCRLPGVEHEALCGHVTRPLDPSRPTGTTIQVHFAVLPALARNKKPDPVLFFAGGPGQSAIDVAPAVAAMLARFTNRRDIVLIDQRGTGKSAPLACDDDDASLPLAEQIDPARQRQRIEACLERLRALPHGDLRFYTTTIAAADADAVRAALGAERVNLVGGSYGTRAALEYQRQFPQRVRRAVIDGVAPPDMVLPASFSTDNQAALDALFNACVEDAACAKREPQLAVRWRALLAALPKTVTLVHPVTGRSEALALTHQAVVAMVRGPLYVPTLASALPSAIGEATRGRFEPLAALASAFGGGRRAMRPAAGMHFAVVCAEDFPRLPETRDAPGVDFGAAFASLYAEVCPRIPRAEVPAAFYGVPAAPAATLVLSGGLDPVTPPRHGERVTTALGAKARHVVVPNAGHGVMAIGCMRDVLYRFVDAPSDDEALKVDASCVTSMPRPPMFALPGPVAAPGASK